MLKQNLITSIKDLFHQILYQILEREEIRYVKKISPPIHLTHFIQVNSLPPFRSFSEKWMMVDDEENNEGVQRSQPEIIMNKQERTRVNISKMNGF